MARWKELKQFHQSDDQRIIRIRGLREQTNAVVLPEGKSYVDLIVRDPTIREEVKRKKAALAYNPPKLRVTPSIEGVTEEDQNATLREKASEEILRVAGSRLPNVENTYAAACDAAIGDGGSWTKFLFSKDLWDRRYSTKLADYNDDENYLDVPDGEAPGGDKKPKAKSKYQKYNDDTEAYKREDGPPFYWLSVDSLAVYPSWAGGRLAEIIEVTERPLSQVLFDHNLTYINGQILPADAVEPGQAEATLDKDGMPAKVTQLEYWNDTYCTYVFIGPNGRHQTDPYEHHMGRVPYFYAPGLLPNYWHGHKCGWSVSESKAWLVDYNSFLLTLHGQVAALQSYPVLFRTRPEGASALLGRDGQPLTETVYKLGTIIEGAPGETLQPLQWPAMAQTFKDQLQLVQKMIDRLDSPRVGSEVGKGLEGAGFAINSVLSEAKLADADFARHLERMIVEVVRFMWHLIRDVVQEPVWVEGDGKNKGWIQITPEDLYPGVTIQVTIDPERATAKLVEARYYHERMRAGTLSTSQAIEAMGDNPDEVRFQQALEEIRQSDAYKQLRNELVFQQVGRGDLVAKAVQLAQSSQTGINAPTTPPSSPVAPLAPVTPPMSPPIPTGSPTGGVGMGDPGALTQSPGGANIGAGAPAPAPGPAAPAMHPSPAPTPPRPPAARRLIQPLGARGGTSGVGPGFVVPLRSAAGGIVGQ